MEIYHSENDPDILLVHGQQANESNDNPAVIGGIRIHPSVNATQTDSVPQEPVQSHSQITIHRNFSVSSTSTLYNSPIVIRSVTSPSTTYTPPISDSSPIIIRPVTFSASGNSTPESSIPAPSASQQDIAELETLRTKCAEQEARIQALQDRLQALQDTSIEPIRNDDLEDQDSVIAELQGRVMELEIQLANARSAAQAEEQTTAETEGHIRILTETLEDHRAEIERLHQQIAEVDHEKGEVLHELMELDLQYQKDLHYVSFYEKLPEEKIDGLESFREHLQTLDSQLQETLHKGIVRAYVGHGTELENQLRNAQQQLYAVLEELCTLVESDVRLDPACFGEAYTADEYKRRAKEQLERYEALLNEMNQAAEQKLKFESIIGFGGEETF